MFRISKRIASVLGAIALIVLAAYLYWKPIPIVRDPQMSAIDNECD